MTVHPFPALVPSSRSFQLGNWPVSKYRAINGTEIRIKYGNEESEAKASLTYENVTDTEASLFITHFRNVFGTFNRFPLDQVIYDGWTGMSTEGPEQAFRGKEARWRYEAPPTITNVRPGVSTVQVSLVAVL